MNPSSRFRLCKIDEYPQTYAQGSPWPPETIPAPSYTLGLHDVLFDQQGPQAPSSREEICDYAFSILAIIQYLPFYYSTMDVEVYTPTKDFLFRGIWIEDYSAHSSEFLLIKQDNESENVQARNVQCRPSPVHEEDETDLAFKACIWEHTLMNTSGRLEAVKLTGDDNVPQDEVILCK